MDESFIFRILPSMIGGIIILILRPYLEKIGNWLIRALSSFSKSYSNSMINRASKRIEPSNYMYSNLILILVIPILITIFNEVRLNSFNITKSYHAATLENYKEYLRESKLENKTARLKIKKSLGLDNTNINLDTTYLKDTLLNELININGRMDSALVSIEENEILNNDNEKKIRELMDKLSYGLIAIIIILLWSLFENSYINELRLNFVQKLNIMGYKISEKQRKKYISNWSLMKTSKDHTALISELNKAIK